MCDAKGARFFRPWNVEELDAEVITVNERADAMEDGGASLVRKRDEDTDSTASGSMDDGISTTSYRDESVVPSGTASGSRHGSNSSSDASSRSCSVHSDEATRSSDLEMNNIIFRSSRATAFSVPRDVRANASMLESSFRAANDPFSTSTRPMEYLRWLPCEATRYRDASTTMRITGPVESHSVQATVTATTGRPFCYALPTMHQLHRGVFSSSMEQAFETVRRQDAAAKRMKKLRPKKFRCEHCDVAFSNNGQLKGHIRIHTGERPFKCDAEGCGKSFTRNEELTRHKRIHTGLRPHACVVCGKCFGRKDHLKKHTRTHENRDPYRVSAAALGMFALGHALPRGPSFPPYVYPI